MTATDEYAEHLAEVAADLVVRVRDDDPEANLRWLTATLPTERERLDLLFVLAAAVPDDRPWLHLTAWARTAPPASGPPASGPALLAERYGDLRAVAAELRPKAA
ncbi:hypothetical protein MCAG_03854 [Micromonospora sp. ATCC 39149]|uniref:hypothetical protein n=1 Tax=Micromonospora sp. (strain ATCC 39149 / NRRL 15099 / SCC 1413) TaxID=219305 RepID=UPI0001A5058F|nr:hypothetical protein [Micromonospora sp. ATCC 39149]EEP73527.1 hypothetical protein MCAG_03854 [Micromonospora sp. ATCC 39149]